jgi:hypothetical protein
LGGPPGIRRRPTRPELLAVTARQIDQATQESGRLDAKTLVANARTKSQPHLLTISKRKSLEDAVTDVLVTRGNREVVNSVANNDGARFSGFGFLHMIKRAEGYSILAEQLGLRKDIPRHLFQQLIAKASDDARKRTRASRHGWPNSDLGDRCHRRAAFQIRPRIEKLFYRKKGRGDAASMRQPE